MDKAEELEKQIAELMVYRERIKDIKSDRTAALVWKITKPVMAVIGFSVFMALVIKLCWGIVDRELTMLILGEFIGVILTITGFLFKERGKG